MVIDQLILSLHKGRWRESTLSVEPNVFRTRKSNTITMSYNPSYQGQPPNDGIQQNNPNRSHGSPQFTVTRDELQQIFYDIGFPPASISNAWHPQVNPNYNSYGNPQSDLQRSVPSAWHPQVNPNPLLLRIEVPTKCNGNSNPQPQPQPQPRPRYHHHRDRQRNRQRNQRGASPRAPQE
ncbi:uncharacterized protein PODANS_5_11117 [Podospora anserina S mat+]|uniref:Podospora anserina S mat+ genomic DNA chromosome 5, supercontig 10 n=1 Tax=Podospora anserina (strain S / ATCC MYA-4624 / DSM 980 / FGSC 10383) TaxID=515849 RepID=B2APP1_PODAN|nr:uncharacterized protein PODANS_5_11117 [Podospora anserina S mat+]CAP65913.1 unnamed protein product [Podospora anserina S mat+]CDP30224.1 Putative protein of unknown function [Podospora anserina S mat+]